MEALLYSEVNIFSIIILLIIALETRILGYDKEFKNKLFIASVWCVAISNMLDFFWNLGKINILPVPAWTMWLINFLYFLAFGCSAFFWCLYAEATHGNYIYRNKLKLVLCSIPLMVLAIILICSFKTGWIFYFDDDNVYHRGPLFYMQYFLSYGYIVVTSIRTLVTALSESNYAYRRNFLTIAAFAVPPIISGLIQAEFRYIPVLTIGIVVSFLLVYIGSLQALISIDPLTGINNRRKMLVDLTARTKSIEKNEKLYFIFIDIDSFKYINDSYGHDEGDRILKIVSSAINEICKNVNGFCARYGGDEFAMALILKKDEDIEVAKNNIRKAVKSKGIKENVPYPIEISIGCSEFGHKADSIQELIHRADNDMYKHKNSRRIEK